MEIGREDERVFCNILVCQKRILAYSSTGYEVCVCGGRERETEREREICADVLDYEVKIDLHAVLRKGEDGQTGANLC